MKVSFIQLILIPPTFFFVHSQRTFRKIEFIIKIYIFLGLLFLNSYICEGGKGSCCVEIKFSTFIKFETRRKKNKTRESFLNFPNWKNITIYISF